MSVITNLRNASVVVALAFTASACTTVRIPTGGECVEGDAIVAPLGLGALSSQHYNATCGQTMAGGKMVQAGAVRNDPGMTAVGVLTLEASNPAIKASGDRVRKALANQGEQTYTVRRLPNGDAVLNGPPIVTVPKHVEEAPTPQAAAAAVPATPQP